MPQPLSQKARQHGQKHRQGLQTQRQQQCRVSPTRRAILSHKQTADMAAKPTMAHTSGPCPAKAGSRSTIATVSSDNPSPMLQTR
jgi:hypothetical protein